MAAPHAAVARCRSKGVGPCLHVFFFTKERSHTINLKLYPRFAFFFSIIYPPSPLMYLEIIQFFYDFFFFVIAYVLNVERVFLNAFA
jgi:hypothetical protein